MTFVRSHRVLLAACAVLGASPAWAQGFAPQTGSPPGPAAAPFAFGVAPTDGGAPPNAPPPFPTAPAFDPAPSPRQPAPQPAPQPPPQLGARGPDLQLMQRLAEAERQDFGVAPQRELHGGPPHAPTPASLPGAQVITTLGLVSLLQQPGLQPVILDALGGTLHLPGALPAAFAAQPGSFNDAVEQRLAALLQQATRGDRTRPLVFYCSDPHCWMSYNAALRAVALQYRNVLWYRGGIWAWQQAGLPLADAQAPRAAPERAGGTQAPVPAPPPAAAGPGRTTAGGAFTMGDLASAVTYGRDGDWTTAATPDGALILSNRTNPNAWMVDTVPQPPLPFVLEMQIASGFAPREGSAVGAGLVFGYKRPPGAPESFYALLLAGNTAILYHRHDGTFDEAARTSIPASRGGGGPSWVSVRVALRENGFSLSLDGDGEISQEAPAPLSGRYGVMASGAGEAAMRNLGIR